MSRPMRWLDGLCLIILLFLGCELSAPCDEGQLFVRERYTCETSSTAAPGPTCERDGYGAPCADSQRHSDCPCEASYCAITPGQSEGICTRLGCLPPDPECPPGFFCMDLSNLAPELGSLCAPQ